MVDFRLVTHFTWISSIFWVFLSACCFADIAPITSSSLDTYTITGTKVLNRPQDYWMVEDGPFKKHLQHLDEKGITPMMNWVSDIQGNPVGGKTQRFREFDNLFFSLGFDLTKLMKAPGTQFHTSFSQRSGTSLSRSDIQNIFNVAQVCCGPTFRVVDVYLEQPFANDTFNLRAGRIAAGDEFLASPLYGLFVQNGFDGNPVGVFYNAPGMTAYPTATWGTRLRFKPVTVFDVMLGIFNGDPTLGEDKKHGLDWSMRGPSFGLLEVGLHPQALFGKTDHPGNYKIGAFYDNGRYPNFLYDYLGGLAPTTKRAPQMQQGKSGYYILVDQMIYHPRGADIKQGLTPFVSFLVAPDQAINRMPYFINGGLVYQGLFPNRPKDALGFGVIYGSISQTLRRAQILENQFNQQIHPQTYEVALEATYMIKAASWLKIQPDIQYIINTGGTGRIPNALVVGAQIGVTLI